MRKLVNLDSLIGRLLGKPQRQPSIVLAHIAGFLATLRDALLDSGVDDVVDDGNGIVGQVELDQVLGGVDGFVDHGNGGVLHRVEDFGLEMTDQTDDGVPEPPAQGRSDRRGLRLR